MAEYIDTHIQQDENLAEVLNFLITYYPKILDKKHNKNQQENWYESGIKRTLPKH